MSYVELNEEDLKNVALRYKINGLSRIANMIPTRYHIYKFNPINGHISKGPNIREIEKYDIGLYLGYNEYINNILKEFVETLTKHSSKVNVNTLYKNLKSLRVTEKNASIITKIEKKLGMSVAVGYYDTTHNKIGLHKDMQGTKKKVITHELIHFSSSVIQKGIIYSGFSQTGIYTASSRGSGINEGTTEYINSYLFGYPPETLSYQDLVFITKGIANLIGNEKLMQLYFSNDLEGLINEISKYSSEKTASTLIRGMDKLYNLRYENLISKDLSTSKELEESLKSLVANLNLKKQNELLANNEITPEEKDQNIFKNVDLYEMGCTLEEQINQKNNKKIYKIKSYSSETLFNEMILNEDEYKIMTMEYKEVINDSNDQKIKHLDDVYKKVREKRRKIVINSDSSFGNSQGYKDVYGNSLDNVQFNYKKISSQIDKAHENGNSPVVISSIDGVNYTVETSTADMMRGFIMKSSEINYVYGETNSTGKNEEMKEMMIDYNDSKKQEQQINSNNKEI